MKKIKYVVIILTACLLSSTFVFAQEKPEYFVFGYLAKPYGFENLVAMAQVYTPDTPTEKEARLICEEVSAKYLRVVQKRKTDSQNPVIIIKIYDSLDADRFQYRAQYFSIRGTGSKQKPSKFEYVEKLAPSKNESKWWEDN